MKLEVGYGSEARELDVHSENQEDFRVLIPERGDPDRVVHVRIISRNGSRWTLDVEGRIEDVLVQKNGESISVDWQNRTYPLKVYSRREKLLQRSSRPQQDGIVCVKTQMPGKVIRVLKQPEDIVVEGEGLVIVESMKMQNELRSPKAGTVVTCCVEEGQTVQAGTLLFEVE